MSTHAPATMRALDSRWRAALTPVYGPTVDVFLGPLVTGDPDDAVFIGYDGDPEGAFAMTQHTQNWRTLGTRARDEEFDVYCCILTMSGSTDGPGVLDAIDRLYGIYDVCANTVHNVWPWLTWCTPVPGRSGAALPLKAPRTRSPSQQSAVRHVGSQVEARPRRGGLTCARRECSQIWMLSGAKRMACACRGFLPSDVPGANGRCPARAGDR